MRGTTLAAVDAEREFAVKAAQHFTEHPEHSSFGDIEKGGLIALRWGLGDDCVLILKLDEGYEPTNYHQIIKKKEMQP